MLAKKFEVKNLFIEQQTKYFFIQMLESLRILRLHSITFL